MDLTYISLEKKDRVAIAWLNKPKANPYDADLMRHLNTMIDDVRFDDDVDVCVIASKLDGVWSAGADINLLASSTPDYKAMFCLNCQETLNKMESTPKLFIAAIDGHCVGGGLEIAMATDLRVAADGGCRVGWPEVTWGVLHGTGGTQRLPRLVGKSRAIDLMATGRMITPKEALEWGLFNRVFPRAKFWDETMAFAKGLTYPQHAARAVGFIKRSVTEGLEMPMYEGFALERELQNRLFAMADAKEGFLLGAILARPRVFEHRLYGHIYDLFVDPARRNRGVGESLVQEALAWFRSRRVEKVDLYTYARNEMGLRFWKKMGFETTVYILDRRI